MLRLNRFAAFAVVLVAWIIAIACLQSETQVDNRQTQSPSGPTPIPVPPDGGGQPTAVVINFIDPVTGVRVSGFTLSVSAASGLATAFQPIVETRDASGQVIELAVSNAIPSASTSANCTVAPAGPRQINIQATAPGDCEALVTMENGATARLPGVIQP